MREDLVAIAGRVRSLGMVPNLTTSGFGMTEARAQALAGVVGQVNVSVDGLASYADVRGWDGLPRAWQAIDHLVAAGVRVGVNTVLTRANAHELEALGDALAARGVAEWQWLRFKPAGRGRAVYHEMALAPADFDRLWPRALAIEQATGLVLRFDCALVPALVAHAPPVEQVQRLGVTGCPGGESLLARSADGRWRACSFADGAAEADPATVWREDRTLRAWRDRAAAPPEPCASCAYQVVCRGGCRVVSAFLTGDALAPDPECPRVRAHG